MCALLVVDENPLVRRFCQMVLTKAGYEVLEAASALEGLQALDLHQDVSVLLLDSTLRSPTIEEILRGIEHRRLCVPVVVLASNGADLDHLNEHYPSVLALLRKPATPVELLDTVNSCQSEAARDRILRRRDERRTPDSELQPQHSRNPAAPRIMSPPALHGQIDLMPVAEILQMLHFQNHTGIYRARQQTQEVSIFFARGRIQFATSLNLENEFFLGQVLLQKRSVKVSELSQALRHHADSTLPVGEYLVRHNFLRESGLRSALQEQTCALIYEVLRWKSGEFSFEVVSTLPPYAEKASLDLSVEGVILEGFRRVDEWKIMEQDLGTPRTVLERTAQPTVRLEGLSATERSILEKVNGSATIAEILAGVLLPRFDVYKTLQNLVAQEVIRRRPSLSEERIFHA